MIATEDVLFVMPRSRELQFPAMAALQMYVNNYKPKMEANCVIKTLPDFRFRYWADMPDADWAMFQRLGIELKQPRQQIGTPEQVIEMGDERLLSFYNSEKHCGQVCAAISGVETPPFPAIRKVGLAKHAPWIWPLDCSPLELPDSEKQIAGDDFDAILAATEQPFDGIVVGRQSWRTYAVAALGLPLIEIVSASQSVNWLSKFKNPLYRVCEEMNLDRLPDTIRNLRDILLWQSQTQAVAKVSETTTELIASTAPTAANT